MRIHPALALVAVLLLVLAATQADEWVRDDMSDESLWLLRTSNLAREAPRAGTLPGAPDGGSHWVMSKGDGPAYVVYFIPGRIHEVEIDTHRLAGAAGDFSLAVSTDGKLYQPLDAGAVLLDTSFGWDYRLMASDQIPENATHLLVQFPDGSTAHSLSEVWIRYTWDDTLASRFLPTPAPVSERAPNTLAAQSDAELQALLEQLLAQGATQPAREVFPLVEQTPSLPAFVAEPFRAPHSVDSTAPVQFQPAGVADIATAPVVIEDEPEDPLEPAAADPDAVSIDATTPAAEPAGNIEIQIEPDAEPATDSGGTSDAIVPKASDTASIDVAVFETPEETSVDILVPNSFPETGVAAADPADKSIRIEVPPTPAVDRPLEFAPPRFDAAESPAAEVSEEVIVLPTFTLPVFVSAEAEEAAPSPQSDPQPQATADSAVFETPSEAVGKPPPLVSVPEGDPVKTRPDTPPDVAASREAAPSVETAPPPIQAAARIEPTGAEQTREFDEDEETDSKPLLKMKRTGPRSKSRGTYVARG